MKSVTNGGIVGKVTKVTDAYVGVEISEGTEITHPESGSDDYPPERHDQVALRSIYLRVRRGPWRTGLK